MKYRLSPLLAAMLLCLLPHSSRALAKETVITTYVTKVQEERESTRFTLTEWLRIKERMKMMDVWLAMFSNPDKDNFSPELYLYYGMTTENINMTLNERTAEKGTSTGQVGRGQLWLTNLVTDTTKIRTLNIDFGVEGSVKSTKNLTLDSGKTSDTTRNHYVGQYSGNFRLFGKNIQDSSLVLKVGQYQVLNSLGKTVSTIPTEKFRGTLLGAELQLYLFRWLGLEGSYTKYGDKSKFSSKKNANGTAYEYGAYIEISLIRLMGGVQSESWQFGENPARSEFKSKGYYGGMKLQF